VPAAPICQTTNVCIPAGACWSRAGGRTRLVARRLHVPADCSCRWSWSAALLTWRAQRRPTFLPPPRPGEQAPPPAGCDQQLLSFIRCFPHSYASRCQPCWHLHHAWSPRPLAGRRCGQLAAMRDRFGIPALSQELSRQLVALTDRCADGIRSHHARSRHSSLPAPARAHMPSRHVLFARAWHAATGEIHHSPCPGRRELPKMRDTVNQLLDEVTKELRTLPLPLG